MKTPREQKLTTMIGAHVSETEKEDIRIAAALDKMPVSQWLRNVALTAAARVLREKGARLRTAR